MYFVSSATNGRGWSRCSSAAHGVKRCKSTKITCFTVLFLYNGGRERNRPRQAQVEQELPTDFPNVFIATTPSRNF